ncbi:MAG: nuclear transport factor 2 family protein [Gemmatimonadales bacterium]
MRFPVRLYATLLASVGFAAPAALHAQIEEGRVPLRTAMTELTTFRTEYADDYNRKDAAAVTAMFDPEASVMMADGTVQMGRVAIGKALAAGAAKWPHLVIKSDSMRVFGNTAVDMGTATYHPASGPTVVERYMVVLRRGMKDWKVMRLAQVTTK